MERADSTDPPTNDLTIFEATEFRNSLVTLLSQEGPISLDLSHVRQMDSSCMQILLAAHRTGRLTVVGLSEQIRQKAMLVGCRELVGS